MLMVLKKNIDLRRNLDTPAIELIETPILSQAGDEAPDEEEKIEERNPNRRSESQSERHSDNLKNKILLVYQRQISLITLTKDGLPVKYTFEVGSHSEFGGRGILMDSDDSEVIYFESVSDIWLRNFRGYTTKSSDIPEFILTKLEQSKLIAEFEITNVVKMRYTLKYIKGMIANFKALKAVKEGSHSKQFTYQANLI